MEQTLNRRQSNAPTLPLDPQANKNKFPLPNRFSLPSPPLSAQLPPHLFPNVHHSANTFVPLHDHAARYEATIDSITQKPEIAMAKRPQARPRGESDLGRSASNGSAHLRHQRSFGRSSSGVENSSSSETTLLFSGLVLPLPWLLSSLTAEAQQLRRANELLVDDSDLAPQRHIYNSILRASVLSTLSLIAIIASRYYVRWRKPFNGRSRVDPDVGTSAGTWITEISWRLLWIWCPFFASIELGGTPVALAVILGTSISPLVQTQLGNYEEIWLICSRNKIKVAAAFGIALRALLTVVEDPSKFLGYSALVVPIFTLGISSTGDSPKYRYWPSFVSSVQDIKYTAASAGITSATSMILLTFPNSWPADTSTILLGSLVIVSIGLGAMVLEPQHFRPNKPQAIVVCSTVVATFWTWTNPHLWDISYTALSALVYYSFVQDGKRNQNKEISGPKDNQHLHENGHKHDHSHKSHHSDSNKPHRHQHSKFTGVLLSFTTPGSIIHSIMSEKDSRRIAYFACINLAFMLVQFFYGFLTGSLGLLSDSIHMLFDCLGLAVGLTAAVMSKWPPSLNFPYGYAKVETLSGFANGIFLILVSVEIVFDAIHRLNEGYELTRLNELLIVSILGFLVNMIGLTAFGHAHHGHSHGHSHDHSHDHSHTHSQNHSHNHSLNHSHSHSHNHSDSSNSNAHFSDNHSHKHSHDNIELSNPNTPALFGPPHSAPPTPFPVVDLHSHTNENMEGIFLHILADALGSVAVIISTLLTKYNSWSGWDPLASCMIAILIFFSAIPLVKSSGLKLLLALSDEAEYRCRGVLQGISELMGIVGYAGVRFWMADQDVGTHHHHKTHEHEHEDKHDHHDHVEKQFARATILGVIHIIASKTADLDDVRDRTDQYLRSRGFDVLVHVETQGEGRCWCGGGIRQAI